MCTSSQLFQDMNRIVRTYQKGIKLVDSQLESTAFFPGGYGLWLEDGQDIESDLSSKNIMVVAPLFGWESDWLATKENPGQNINKQWWQSVRCVLNKVCVDLDDVFFTNAYAGLYKDVEGNDNKDGKNQKNKKAPCLRKTGKYFEECKRFFIHQIQIQNPNLVIAIGIKTVKFLSRIEIGLEVWRGKTMKTIINDNDCERRITFGGKNIAVVSIQDSLNGIEQMNSVDMIRKYVKK